MRLLPEPFFTLVFLGLVFVAVLAVALEVLALAVFPVPGDLRPPFAPFVLAFLLPAWNACCLSCGGTLRLPAIALLLCGRLDEDAGDAGDDGELDAGECFAELAGHVLGLFRVEFFDDGEEDVVAGSEYEERRGGWLGHFLRFLPAVFLPVTAMDG